ncbi:PAS domain S-box protein [Massilia cavernae]|uniref:PAS domain S-box protein n=1 Tax=Massilia cavernae TaxID=2320864 RepID=UPI0016029656|nr:PAS domain S-box protein [Massilia cavernae]
MESISLAVAGTILLFGGAFAVLAAAAAGQLQLGPASLAALAASLATVVLMRLRHLITTRKMAEAMLLTDISRRKEAELELCAIRMRAEHLMRENEQLRAETAVRQAAERAQVRSAERLQNIIATLPVALMIKDPQSRITFMNNAAEKGWGLSFPEMVGKTGAEMFTPDQMEKILATDRAAFANREVIVEDRKIWNVARVHCRQYELVRKPVFDAGGQPDYLICVFIDITERKLAQAALQLSYQQLRQVTARLELMKAEDGERIAKGNPDDLGQNLLALRIDVECLHARAGDAHSSAQGAGRACARQPSTPHRSVRRDHRIPASETLELGLPVAAGVAGRPVSRSAAAACTLPWIGVAGIAGGCEAQCGWSSASCRSGCCMCCDMRMRPWANVTLSIGAEQLSITILDDGVGVVEGNAGKDAACALRGIRERVNVFGGELAIDSGDDTGTTLSILIPTAAAVQA